MTLSVQAQGSAALSPKMYTSTGTSTLERHDVGVGCSSSVFGDLAFPRSSTCYRADLTKISPDEANLMITRVSKLRTHHLHGFAPLTAADIDKDMGTLVVERPNFGSSSSILDCLRECIYNFSPYSLVCWKVFLFFLRVIKLTCGRTPPQNAWLDILNTVLQKDILQYVHVQDTGLLVIDSARIVIEGLRSGTSTIQRIADETTPVVLEVTLIWALGSYFSNLLANFTQIVEPGLAAALTHEPTKREDPWLSPLRTLVDEIASGDNSLPAAALLRTSVVRRVERIVDERCLITRSDRGFTQLMTAARENDIDGTRKFLYQQGFVSFTPLELTALMIAVRNRSLEATEILAPYEACHTDTSGFTALMYCVQNKLYSGAKILAQLECGVRNKENKTAIYMAYEQKNYEMLKILAPWENHMMYTSGKTLLMIAAEENDLSAVKLLLEFEGGISDRSGHMAARYALLSGYKDVFNALLPVEGTILKRFGCTPLIVAVAQDNVKEIVMQMNLHVKRRFKGLTALMTAVLFNSSDEVLEMLEKKEARLATNKGQTALMLAVQKGHRSHIKRLAPLEAGLFDKKGNTAFMYAVLAEDVEAIQELGKYEAGLINPVTEKTAMQMLEERQDIKSPKAAKILSIVQKIESFKRDSYGNIPLIHAVIANDENMFKANLCQARIRNYLGRTALHFAVELCNLEFAKVLVKEGAAGLQDYSGYTALMLDVMNGSSDFLDLLIAGGEAGAVNNDGKSAMIIALETGNIAAAMKLVNYEAGITDATGTFASKIAAMCGYTDVFCQLYEREKNLLYNYGFTPLMLAAIRGNIKELRQALHLGARTTLQDGDWTALMFSVVHGNQEACRLLLPVEGCLVNAEGKTALMLAAELDMHMHVKLLSKAEAGMRDCRGMTALMFAAMRGHPENVTELMKYEAGISSNARQTAASLAYWSKYKRVFFMLSQVELDIRDSKGNTELMKAVVLRDVDMVKANLRLACLKNYKGETALMMAVREEFLEAVDILADLECGIQDFNGSTALIIACEASFLEAVALLLCEINICRFNGSSPRSVALTCNHYELGRLLPKKPLLDSAGCTQLMLAIEANDETLAMTPQMLELRGIQDFNGRTALMCAAERNMCKVVKALIETESQIFDYSGQTAAWYAYKANALDALALLIKHEALHYNNENRSIFMCAVVDMNIEAIQIVATYEAGYQLPNGTTALSLARALTGPRAKEILDNVLRYETDGKGTAGGSISEFPASGSPTKVDLNGSTPDPQDNGRDNEGNTALIRMVRSNPAADITQLMHQAGMVNRKGMTALMFAAELNNVAAARLLADKEAGHTIASHVSTPFVLSDATALHIAAMRGNTEIVKLLIEHEAQMVDYRKRTAMMLAAYFGHLSVVHLLIDKEKGLQDSSGRSALFYAIENNKIHVVRELSLHEATLTTTMSYMAGPGFTALMDAARLGNIAAIRLLITREGGMAQPKEAGKHSNWSALVWAASHGQKEAILELAPLEAENYGPIAFYYAQDIEIAEALIRTLGRPLQ